MRVCELRRTNIIKYQMLALIYYYFKIETNIIYLIKMICFAVANANAARRAQALANANQNDYANTFGKLFKLNFFVMLSY